jgi:hypothetical protein
MSYFKRHALILAKRGVCICLGLFFVIGLALILVSRSINRNFIEETPLLADNPAAAPTDIANIQNLIAYLAKEALDRKVSEFSIKFREGEINYLFQRIFPDRTVKFVIKLNDKITEFAYTAQIGPKHYLNIEVRSEIELSGYEVSYLRLEKLRIGNTVFSSKWLPALSRFLKDLLDEHLSKENFYVQDWLLEIKSSKVDSSMIDTMIRIHDNKPQNRASDSGEKT